MLTKTEISIIHDAAKTACMEQGPEFVFANPGKVIVDAGFTLTDPDFNAARDAAWDVAKKYQQIHAQSQM